MHEEQDDCIKGKIVNKNVVLITGASSGIGAGLALAYAKKEAQLLLVSRRQDKLKSVADECNKINPNCHVLTSQCDVNSRDDLIKAVNLAKEKFGSIDTVFANAGFGIGGKFEKLEIADFRRQFETNIFGVLNTIYATLDELKKSKGRLCLLGSVNSYIAQPMLIPYSMTKFSIKALADGLYYQLKSFGISVTLVCPGIVESEIRRVDKYGQFNPAIKESAPKALLVSTTAAVNEIVSAVEKRKKEKVVTSHGRILVFLQRHFPWLLTPLFHKRIL